MDTSHHEMDDVGCKPETHLLGKRPKLQEGRSGEEAQLSDCHEDLDHSKVKCQESEVDATVPTAPCLSPRGQNPAVILDEMGSLQMHLHLDGKQSDLPNKLEAEILCLKRKIVELNKKLMEKDMDYNECMARNKKQEAVIDALTEFNQILGKQLKQPPVCKCTASPPMALHDLDENVGNNTGSNLLGNVVVQYSKQPTDDPGLPKPQDEVWIIRLTTCPEETTQPRDGIPVANDGINNNCMNVHAAGPMLTGSNTFTDDLSGNEVLIGSILPSVNAFPVPISPDEELEKQVDDNATSLLVLKGISDYAPRFREDSSPVVVLPKGPNIPVEMEADDSANELSRINVLLGTQLEAGVEFGPDTAMANETFADHSSGEVQRINDYNSSSPSSSGTKRPPKCKPTIGNNMKQRSPKKPMERKREGKNWPWKPQNEADFVDEIVAVRKVLTVRKEGKKPLLPTDASVFKYIEREDLKTQRFPSATKMKSKINNIIHKYQEYAKKHPEYQHENSMTRPDIKASDACLERISRLLRADKLRTHKLR